MEESIEILAPAGNAEMLYAAVLAGADAVYLGLQSFSARRTAGNFTIDALRQAVAFCHARNVRVHVALNTVLYPAELPEMAAAVRAVAQAGADAVIAQDLAVAALVRKTAPTLALHGSTQMSVHSLEGARELAELGFARVILSRELSLPEIQQIAAHCGIETEVFVHGALCMSVSGQCYMSAFLGGRSGNRGACAGPCRLPFCAQETDAPALKNGEVAQGANHLSLKDMSHTAALPLLQQAGVRSVKIEGRLRSPEYVAAAVNACRCALTGESYDTALLRNVFSRSGFTDGYIEGKINGDMFGMRTGEDAAAAREAMPRLRELFRRERAGVPVTMQVHLEEEGAKLTAADANGNKAVVYSGEANLPQPAQKDQTENIRKALSKTGGTPFYLSAPEDVAIDRADLFLPASEWNEMRRTALEALLQKRSALRPHACAPQAEVETLLALQSVPPMVAAPNREKRIFAQFETLAQMPEMLQKTADTGAQDVNGLILPLETWQEVPAALRAKTWLALPRWLAAAGAEEAAASRIEESKAQGFAGYYVQNLAHIRLCRGLPMFGAFGLNITNSLAASCYAQMGLSAMTLSPELLCSDMAAIAPTAAQPAILGAAATQRAAGKNAPESRVETAAVVYGHLPLMLTRACPLQNVHTCKGCPQKGTLLDRKGKYFPVHCTAPAAAGVRTVYNPVPIYMGDKQNELPVDIALLMFTTETAKEAAEVLRLVHSRQPYQGEFTRGLYFKGTQ